jgi:hypothetical protein
MVDGGEAIIDQTASPCLYDFYPRLAPDWQARGNAIFDGYDTPLFRCRRRERKAGDEIKRK